MKLNKKELNLYAVTQRYNEDEDIFLAKIKNCIEGGATIIQLREKEMCVEKFTNLANKVKKICDEFNIKLIVNDNVNVAMNVNAHGIHLGQNDIELVDCIKLLGKNKVFGVSVENEVQALKAWKNGASYIGVGTIFPTNTKLDAKTISLETLNKIIKTVDIPVVAIGGINTSNLSKLKDLNLAGIAVVSAIFNNEVAEIYTQTKKIKQMWNEVI